MINYYCESHSGKRDRIMRESRILDIFILKDRRPTYAQIALHAEIYDVLSGHMM